jgi:hypothetical protein
LVSCDRKYSLRRSGVEDDFAHVTRAIYIAKKKEKEDTAQKMKIYNVNDDMKLGKISGQVKSNIHCKKKEKEENA